MTHSGVRAFLFAIALALAGPASAQEVVVLAGGDFEWSRVVRSPDIYWDPATPVEGGWHRVPYVATPESRSLLESRGRMLEPPDAHHRVARRFDLEFGSDTAATRHPLRRLAPVLRSADIAFLNLEMPLSDDARRSGAFRGPTAQADALRWAGIDVVSTANNHALDAEGQGLIDTLVALREAGIQAAGTGSDLEEARRPAVLERSGLRIAFLAYTNYLNAGASGFAAADRSGAAPLDPLLIREDIRRVRGRADVVILSFHWGLENGPPLHPDARPFARALLDAGADVILGHGPHLPRGIETHGGGVVVYSMGNLVFGHNHEYWGDNMLVRLALDRQGVRRVEVLPLGGTGAELAQPDLLRGERARSLLEEVARKSAALGTEITIGDDVGVIQLR